MSDATFKKLKRKERKVKKLAAFLEIAKLNDKDRMIKAAKQQKRDSGCPEDGVCDESLGNLKRKQPKLCASQSHMPCQDANFMDCDVIADKQLSTLQRALFSQEELLQLKAELKERKKILKAIPRFSLKQDGENALLTVREDVRTPVFFTDIQHLLIYSLLGHHSPYWPTRWCHLEKFNRLSHTVVVLIEGFSVYDYIKNEALTRATSVFLPHQLEIITPAVYNGNFVQELATVPLTGVHRSRLLNRFGTLESAAAKGEVYKVLRAVFPISPSKSKVEGATNGHKVDVFPRTDLLLSASQLVEENYPMPLKGELRTKYASYITTKHVYTEVTESSPMFGLDCEMVQTEEGLELARISLVDENLQVIYDTLVKPEKKIINYLTQYSGITKKKLDNTTVRLPEVQQKLRNLLPGDAILVGQSLNFDLHALKMIHPYVIDTSVIFNLTGHRKRKSKLSSLAEMFLQEKIQNSSEGHCSIEDSATCIKLAQLKLSKSIEFGDAVLTDIHNPSFGDGFQRNGAELQPTTTSTSQESQYVSSVFNYVSKKEKTVAVVSYPEIIEEYSAFMSKKLSADFSKGTGEQVKKPFKCHVVNSDKEIIKRTCEIAMENSLTVGHLNVSSRDEEQKYKFLKKWIKRIWKNTAQNGLCIVILGGQKGAGNGACFIGIKSPPIIVA